MCERAFHPQAGEPSGCLTSLGDVNVTKETPRGDGQRTHYIFKTIEANSPPPVATFRIQA